MFSKLNLLKRFFIVTILLMSSACEDHDHDHDDHDHDHDETHIDAEGFKLENSAGDEVYRQFQGLVTTSYGGTAIVLASGDELELSVHFLDDTGEEIPHDEEEGEEEDLLVIKSNSTPSVATVESEAHEEEGDEEHGFGIHIHAESSGTTEFVFELMHGTHVDFTSLSIAVTVQ